MTAGRDPGSEGSPLDRVADLFERLLALDDPDTRRAFVADVEASDPDLGAELRELLEAHLADPRFLETPLPTEDRALVSDELDQALAGRRIGPWQIDGVLHHGGMGTVYRAHRVGADFEQHVALKVIRMGSESPELIGRFTLERQLLARLEHPGIARLLEGGTTEEGLPYLVMEFVPGDPIDEWCDREAPSVDDLLVLFEDLCRAVDFAHRNLVIHRDIKPTNILVTPDGAPKLLDFGIAKLMDVSGAGETMPLTRHRMLTPAYASPEQYRGDPVSTATDVYSLGVLLYRLLTGSPPYRIGENTTVREVERLICETMPVPPSQALPEPDRRRRRLRGDLDTIVLKALRKEPARRYPSALAFAEDLQRYRAGLPVTARPDTLAYRTRRFVARHWAGVGAAAAIVLALTGGLGAAMWQGAVAQQQRDVARAEAATAESAVEFLKTVLWSGNPWDDFETVESVDDVLRYAEAQIDSLLVDEPAARAYILAALSEIGVGRGELERAERFSARALDLLDAEPEATASRVGDVYRAHSLALQELGRLEEARDFIFRAIAAFEAQDPPRVDALGEALNQAGTLEGDLGNADEAEAWFRRALEFRRAHGATAPERMSTLLNNLAVVLMGQGDRLEDAAEAYADLIPIAREARFAAPRLATLLTNRANLRILLGEFDAAEADFTEALSLMEGSIGPEHPSTLTAATSLGSLYEVADELERAEATLRPVLALGLAHLPGDHPTIAYTQNTLATVLCRAGGAAAGEGLELARASLATRAAGLPADHWALASGASVEGLCLLELDRHDEARALLEGALPILREQRGEGHRLTTRARDWLARLEQVSRTPAP